MSLLIAGLALWWASHMFPLLARPRRDALVAAMGETPYKIVYSLVALGAVVMMVKGFQRAEIVDVWAPPVWATHLNNLLMLIAVGLFAASHSKGNVKRYVRHPMNAAVLVWAVAHLLVNGDLASIVLFGGMGLWAIAAIVAANARDGEWVKPDPAPRRKDIILVVITVVAFAAIAGIHFWLGYPTFPQ